MTRKQLVQKYFHYASQLTWSDDRYRGHVSAVFDWMAAADQTEHDPTGTLLSLDGDVTAVVVSKQKGIVAGVEEVIGLLSRQKSITINSVLHDGNIILPKDEIVLLHGPAEAILSMERLILSFIGRMSGIATRTHQYISLLSEGPAIAATRKTPWMLLDKKAVAVGGGLTHRLDLASPMIKDNHLVAIRQLRKYTAPEEAVAYSVRCAVSSEHPFFEIEVNSLQQAQVALEVYAQAKKHHTKQIQMAIMLDNMNPASATAFTKSLRNHPLLAEIFVEASGEITEESLKDWAKTGVDVISIGALTHSAPVANVSLEIV